MIATTLTSLPTPASHPRGHAIRIAAAAIVTLLIIAVSIVGNNEMSLPMIMNTPVALCFVLAFVTIARRTERAGRTAPAAA